MILSIIIFLISLVPSILIIIWLRNRHKEDLVYKKSCTFAFWGGIIGVLPIILLSGTLYLINILFFRNMNVFVYVGISNFIVAAFAEEIIKYSVFRVTLKKRPYSYSWADVTAVMVIVGTAFGLLEDIPYALETNPIQMLVRGISMGHVGYGFIMGWFYGKKLYTGKKIYGVIAILLPWFIHGLYDFSLAPEFLALNENFAFIAMSLAVLDIVLLVLMIRFFIRSKKKEHYQQPVLSAEQ